MPYARRRKAAPKKAMRARRPAVRRRVQRKRRIARVQKYTIRNLGFGFPSTKVIPMRYSETVTISGASGAMGKYTFRANSIYDPNLTGTGHQPQGQDQWAAFYGRYTVIGSRIRVYNSDSAVSQAYPFVMGIQINNDSATISSDYTEMIEQGRNKFMIHNSNFGYKKGMSLGFSLKKFFNLTNVKDNMQTHGAHFGSNPLEEAYFTIWIQDQDKASTVGNKFLVIIDYSVLLSEPKNLAQS